MGQKYMRYRNLLLAAASVGGIAAATAAYAQPAAPADVDAVVVTGTRVARSRLDTVAPVDVINSTALTRQSTTELGQALANVAPSLDFPRPAITDGTDSVRPATLRGLAPDQALVLLNGKRYHASALVNVNGSIGRGSSAVDLNTIPTAALNTVEILRDGASAQYGSDAIAGVMNLRLREASSGGGASATYGEYDTTVKTVRQPGGRKAHDGNTYSINGWQGLKLGAEGFLTLTGDYSYRNPTNRSDLDPRPAGGGGTRVTARYGDPQMRSATGFFNAGLPMGDNWKAYAFGGYQNRVGNSAANPRLGDNANNVPSIYPQGFLPKIGTNIDDANLAGGMKGDIGAFTADFSIAWGMDRVDYTTFDSLNASRGAASPTSMYAGRMEYGQTLFNADFTRALDFGFKSTTLAFGAEHRMERYEIQAGDPASYDFGGAAGKGAGAQGFPGFKPSNQVSPHRNSQSAYIDLDTQFNDKFDVDLAARYEHYSDFGSTTTGKIAARYDIVEGFAIRGAFSTGFRAPSLQQSYFTSTSTNFIPINGVSTPVDVGTFPASAAVSRALGSADLEPEKSKNYSLGLVYHQGPFEVTVDAYQIDIDNRIVLSENIQGSPTGSATAMAIYNLINSTPGSALGAARFFINGVDTTTKGIDIVAHYRLPTENAGRFDFTLASNFNNTEVTRIPTTRQLSALPVPPILFDRGNRLTFESGTPAQKYVGSVDWSMGIFGANVKATKYGSVLIPGATAANANLDYRTGSHTLVDAEARVDLPYGVQWAVGANNLFDEYPNQTPTIVNTNGPIGFPSYSPFGFNGRYLYSRVSVKW
jgi:iron complex outermembrane receptor protein